MTLQHSTKWNMRFLQLAEHIAQWSKDPSTKVGAVIVRPNKTIVSVGFNGLPRGITDDDAILNAREKKYEVIVHAEDNALLMAKEDLTGCSLYTWPLPPCSRCAGRIIQAGIGEVIALCPIERWQDNCQQGYKLLTSANVKSEWIPDKVYASYKNAATIK